MSKIQVLVGMVASGKSSYCRNAAKQGVICMNDDAIVNMLHGENYTLYDPKLKLLYKSIENHVIATSLAMGRIVAVDRGLNIDARGRARWVSLAKSFDVPCEAILFHKDTPEIHAKRRTQSDARNRTYDYWLSVARNHSARHVEPTTEEGFTAIHYVSFEDIQAGKVF